RLQSLAKIFTCPQHVKSSLDFAYHWLASCWLDGFLMHMQWPRIVTEWTCLSTGATRCTAKLDGTTSTDIYRTTYAALTRLAVGVGKRKSMLNITRNWLCKDHQLEAKTQLKTLRQRCQQHWSALNLPTEFRKCSSPNSKRRKSDSENGYSQLNGFFDEAMGPEDFEAIQHALREDQDCTSAIPSKSSKIADTTQKLQKTSPWNDPELFQDDAVTTAQADILFAPSFNNISTIASQSPGSRTKIRLNTQQPYRLPGMFSDQSDIIREASCVLEEIPAPRIPEAVSETMFPTFEPCKPIDNKKVFNNLFKRLRERLPPDTNQTRDGHVYVFSSKRSPKHVKIGITTRALEKREMELIRCAGELLAVKAIYN
ncbi:MAG: hypothetical protein Q9180_005401, partial [Flavoplaca navasiana]